jgi:hypothetical protein
MTRVRQRREKSWLCSLSRVKSCMGSKFLRPFKRQVMEANPSRWDRSTPFSMASKKRGWSSLVGEMKSAVSEAERADVIIALQDWAQQFSATSNASVQISWHGSQCEVEVSIPISDATPIACLELELGIAPGTMSRSPRSYKTWADRWVAYPVICLFSEDQREEWIGDLYEVRDGLIDRGYPRWLVNLIITGRTLILVVSALKITVMELLSKGFRQSS